MSTTFADYLVLQDESKTLDAAPGGPGSFLKIEFDLPADFETGNFSRRPFIQFKIKPIRNSRLWLHVNEIIGAVQSNASIDINISGANDQVRTYHEVLRDSDFTPGGSNTILIQAKDSGSEFIIADVILFFQRRV